MKCVAFRSGIAVAAALLLCGGVGPAGAQQQPDWRLGPYEAADWTAVSQLPDFNGVWELSFGPPPSTPAPAAGPAGGAAPARPPAGHRCWSKNTVRPGDKVTLIISPLKNGDPGGMFSSLILPDGKTMNQMGISPTPSPAPAG